MCLNTGGKPILSRSGRSPRQNVVHPMVEGCVFSPVSIPIRRVTLEDTRRCRLQERAEGKEVLQS